MPFYNVEQYLPKALDSCINQTMKDIEIILVDDCSVDNSLKIAQDYASKDTRIKIICQKENQGQGVARNVAIEKADSEYIMFLDSDDWLELDACEVMYNAAKENNANVVQSPFYWFYFDKSKTRLSDPFTKFSKNNHIEIIPNSFVDTMRYPSSSFRDFNSAPHARIYNLDFIKTNKIEFATIKNGEDVQWSTDIKLSTPIFYINIPTYNRLCRPNSITTSTEIAPVDEIVKSITKIVKKHSKFPKIEKKYRQSVVWWYMFKYKSEKHLKNFNFFKYLKSVKNNTYNFPLLFLLVKICIFELLNNGKYIFKNIFSIHNEIDNSIRYKMIIILWLKIRLKT